MLAMAAMINACARGGCDFYDCIEQTWPCGAGGYALDYGKVYCHAFTDAAHRFSQPEGHAWVTATRLCLQEALWQGVQPTVNDNSTTTCAKIRYIALESHSKCYISPSAGLSVCSILSDWPTIVSIASGAFLYDFQVALSQASETVSYCLNAWLYGSE